MSLSDEEETPEKQDGQHNERPKRMRKAPNRYHPDLTGITDDFAPDEYNSSSVEETIPVVLENGESPNGLQCPYINSERC
jgi:hypothetical protein